MHKSAWMRGPCQSKFSRTVRSLSVAELCIHARSPYRLTKTIHRAGSNALQMERYDASRSETALPRAERGRGDPGYVAVIKMRGVASLDRSIGAYGTKVVKHLADRGSSDRPILKHARHDPVLSGRRCNSGRGKGRTPRVHCELYTYAEALDNRVGRATVHNIVSQDKSCSAN